MRAVAWVERHRGRIVAVWMLVILGAVGVIGMYLAGEDDRFQAVVTAEQARQAAEGMRRTQALCRDFKGRAESDVPRTTSDLGRVLVRTAAANYALLGCERYTGTLALGKPDKEAYRIAPPPPSPTR